MSIPYGFVLRIIFGIILTLYYQLKEESRYRYPITIINQSDIIETHLQTYHDQLGIHYESYRNHCYRVLTYTMHFLKDVKNIYNDIIETSIVYHDLGLYNIVPIEEDSNIDHIVANSYLDESAYLAYQNTKSIYTTKQLEFQSKIISSHHKLWPFGNAGDENKILEAIRRADWIDSTYGYLNKGMSRRNIQNVMKAIPSYTMKSHIFSKGFYKNALHIFKW